MGMLVIKTKDYHVTKLNDREGPGQSEQRSCGKDNITELSINEEADTGLWGDFGDKGRKSFGRSALLCLQLRDENMIGRVLSLSPSSASYFYLRTELAGNLIGKLATPLPLTDMQ